MDKEPEAPSPPEKAPPDVLPPEAADAIPRGPADVPAPASPEGAAPASLEAPRVLSPTEEAPRVLSPTEDVPPVAERVAPTPTATELMPPVEEDGPAVLLEDPPQSLAGDPQSAAEPSPSPLEDPPALLRDPPAPPRDPPRAVPQATPPDTAPVAKRPRKRRWLTGLAVFFGLLVTAAIAVVVLGPGYVRGRILEEALARGVVLAFDDMDLSLSQIRLHDVRIGLAGVRDFEASAGWVDVTLVDQQPTSITAGQLAITLTGTDVLGALGTWKSEHAAALAAPLSGEDAHLEWHPSPGTAPALSLDGAKVAVDAQKGRIDASATRFLGRDAGPIALSWTSPPEGFVVEIKPAAPPLSAAHIEVRSTKDGARLKLTLARTPLGPLQSALGIPKGSEALQVEGDVEMPVPSVAQPAPVEGTLRLVVKGYTPPHPRELDGILFGDTTTVRSKFTLAADLTGAKLTGLTAEAGALSLTGTGDVAREGLDARVSLKLKGTIPCTSLATSAAVARLGAGLGRLAGGLAAGALTGTVSVSLSVDAKASDIKGAKITQSARIGCKVSLPGLPTIILR